MWRRRVVYFVSGVSFLLLLACAAGWVRSYFALDEYRYGARGVHSIHKMDGTHYVLSSGKGKVQWLRCEARSAAGASMGLATKEAADVFALAADRPVDRGWRVLGVEYFDRPRHSYQQGTTTFDLWAFRYLTVPYWTLCVSSGVMSLPGLMGFVWVLRRRRRVRKGLCGDCGYDQRGSSSGRCPECGSETRGGVVGTTHPTNAKIA